LLEALDHSVRSHHGQFHCHQIHKEGNKKVVNFRHVALPPDSAQRIPSVNGLPDFYSTFGQLTLYVDEVSGDAAYHLASPNQWAKLDGDFRPWLDGVEQEGADLIPSWVSQCIVIGEVPRSGNYLLVPIEGPEVGHVYEFEHDGFEFLKLADSLPDFVMKTLDLDPARLTAIASHLRFITGDHREQWWITELRDNRGNVVRTEA
jgi:hypothetical protein